MQETEEKYFERLMKEADELYANGEWLKAIKPASMAKEVAKTIGNNEYIAEALNRRGWSTRYVGFKSKIPNEINELYKDAYRDWQGVLSKSTNLKTRISAIKGLILLPGENVNQLCDQGMLEIKNDQQEKENLKAELINSKAIELRKTDPLVAFNMFTQAYETVQHRTVIAGHLLQNAGTCWLMLLKDEKDLYNRKHFAQRAILCLEKALEEYPNDQTEHRKSTQNKLDNTRKDLEKFAKEYEEEKDKTEKEEQLRQAMEDAEGPTTYSGKSYNEV